VAKKAAPSVPSSQLMAAVAVVVNALTATCQTLVYLQQQLANAGFLYSLHYVVTAARRIGFPIVPSSLPMHMEIHGSADECAASLSKRLLNAYGIMQNGAGIAAYVQQNWKTLTSGMSPAKVLHLSQLLQAYNDAFRGIRSPIFKVERQWNQVIRRPLPNRPLYPGRP
jgi:hypothetical protein